MKNIPWTQFPSSFDKDDFLEVCEARNVGSKDSLLSGSQRAIGLEVKMNLRHSIALPICLAVFLGGALAQAATFTIADGDVTGLINAITNANANGVSNTINLASHGSYTLI